MLRMLEHSYCLKHYARKEIIEELLYNAQGREIAVRFNESFGKRPDTIKYPDDVITLVKAGATSFHCSQELWKNPLQLGSASDKKALEDLRVGWDLIIDIDCKIWELSKLVAYFIIKALRKHRIVNVSCKFSGNKGFHIAVPFEAFIISERVNNQEIRSLFPEGTKKILSYLSHYIDSRENDFELTRLILSRYSNQELAKLLDVEHERLFRRICEGCGKEKRVTVSRKEEITCPACSERNTIGDESFVECKKCRFKIRSTAFKKEEHCISCNNTVFIEKLNTPYIIGLDTIMISPRHLFRMAYSLHETSGLCSLPINPDNILAFEKVQANPENITYVIRFLNNDNIVNGQAKSLLISAYDYSRREVDSKEVVKQERHYELPAKAVSEKFFPPCIRHILNGMPDGRKRSLFILINFLSSLNWDMNDIRKSLIEWNKKNNEQLRENYIESQINYALYNKKKILPPNCKNLMYYVDIGVCKPDNLCSKISNPVNYAIRKQKPSNI